MSFRSSAICRHVYLVRHGDTRNGKPKRYRGHTDVPLSEIGEGQARSLKVWFSDKPLARIVSSDLSRSSETARVIATEHPAPVEHLSELREIHLGDWEGRAFADIAACFPDAFRDRGENIAHHRPPNGESFQDLHRRVIPAASRLIRETTGDLLIVAHAGVNRVILCHLLGMPLKNLFRIEQSCGGISVIIPDMSPVRVKAVNLVLEPDA